MENNRGTAVIEACITIPLFLFFMLFVIYVYRMFYADARIHQCLAEASIYYAQRCYLEDKLASAKEEVNGGNVSVALAGTAVINNRFRKYLGDDVCMEQVVAGGKKGIVITVLPDGSDDKVFVARAVYMSRIDIPLLCKFTIPRVICIKQKAFLGYEPDGEDSEDVYVYITPNEEVYHLSRNCSHLKRDIHEKSGVAGGVACSFCARRKRSDKVYVTDSGEVYHNDPYCLGLKRTVMRVKKSTVLNLGPCMRCGKEMKLNRVRKKQG